MSELYGYVGKILRVDLTTEKVTETSSEEYVPKFFGGRGLGAKIYWDEIPPEVGALDPENKLIFTTGPMQGTGVTAHGRSILTAKSPQIYPTNSYMKNCAGGDWGPELKYAGYDALIVEGKASEPVYLSIQDGHVEFRDAKHLWGLDTFETRNAIWSRHGKKARIAVIGPAGENLVVFACVLVGSGHAFGQGGFGAVMGSKNLKAIAVRGTGRVEVAKPAELVTVTHQRNRLIALRVGEKLVVDGKTIVAPARPEDRASFLSFYPPSKLEDEMREGKVRIGLSGCAGCPNMCFAKVEIVDGTVPSGAAHCCNFAEYNAAEQRYYGGKGYGRVAWEAAMLNNLLGVNGWFTMTETGTGLTESRPNYGGLDILCALNAAGIFTEENTGLPWDKVGSAEFYRTLMRMIAYREGFGDILAQGYGAMAEYVAEHEEFGPNRADAIRIYQIGYPRAGNYGGFPRHWLYAGPMTGPGIPSPVKIIVWATSNRDGSNPHIRLDTAPKEWVMEWLGSDGVLNQEWDTSKVQGAILHQHMAAEADSLIYCDSIMLYKSSYTADGLLPKGITVNGGPEFWNVVMGTEVTQEDLWLKAERILNLERAIMVREGRMRSDDTFFDPLFAEPWLNPDWTPTGNLMIPRDKFNAIMDEYYQTRGWDVATGIPTRAKLEELDLKEVADELQTLGKL